ncbi:hypothetical protein BKA64DRAFT_42394 [Cadophora sp. MPI-SDFR-AT-0126]|nr:hypothetical protein BKA64DRAFT_42394 [Leotiomycetes sp. MPI-SDFR-AT-0126]
MQSAVAELNAYIIRFLVRAHDWYRESPWKHLIHSITQPSELRYDDLVESIARSSALVHSLAVSGQQVELRHLHDKIDEIHDMVNSNFDQINIKVAEMCTSMNLQSAAMVSMNHTLSDIQFSQIMQSISDTTLWDRTKSLHYLRAARRRTCNNPINYMSRRFWNSPKLNRWTYSENSDIAIVKGNFRSRQALRNSCIEIIEQLQASQVPVLLAMKDPQAESNPSNISPIDLIKYLIRQALPLKKYLQTEKSMSLSCAQFHGDYSEADWFRLLQSALVDIGRQVYLIVDLELLNHDFCPQDGFPWLSAFLTFFAQLSNCKGAPLVKVLLVSYGAELPFTLSSREHDDFVIYAKTEVVTRNHRGAQNAGAKKLRGGLQFGDRRRNVQRSKYRGSRREM